ncbi:CPBP family intramembrane glutamic endopeptidase [Proteiniclasticum sp.]|uniref:CPBP family intramembrane glutamic endopeptidase n=1 Tax=Proteiniclasticum sp. TaxID=2053595 RepID=UPI00289BAC2A|nr:CPBP family intramembrane glutamic endopeptidase [Proteiniclasticum sp.]
MIVSQWGIFLVPLMLMKRNREKLSDFFISEIKLWRQIQTGIILALAMTVVLILIPILLGLEYMVGSTSYTMPWQFVFEFIYSIIGVALAEELVFRGYIFNKIVLLSGSRSTAIILSSILFGFFHVFNGNVLQIIMTFCMGMMFCYFREKIKSCTIISLIIAHGLYDGMIVLLVKFL